MCLSCNKSIYYHLLLAIYSRLSETGQHSEDGSSRERKVSQDILLLAVPEGTSILRAEREKSEIERES